MSATVLFFFSYSYAQLGDNSNVGRTLNTNRRVREKIRGNVEGLIGVQALGRDHVGVISAVGESGGK